jgi:hypothetical protein
MLCVVCTMHEETRSVSFWVEPQNQGRQFVSGLALQLVMTVFSGLTSKPVATVSPDLASKPGAQVFWFGNQNRQLRFGDLGLKIIATVSWFGPQNQAGYNLSIVP